jgi:uncharacterized GH25 family protein
MLALTVPARAHFIWLLPQGDRGPNPAALMIFSDRLQPDADVPVSKIATIKLFARGGLRGEAVQLKIEGAKDAYLVQPALAEDGIVLVGGVCTYGVMSRGQGEPFLLMYYPKTLVKRGAARKVDWVFAHTEQLPLEIVPLKADKAVFQVLWLGKPVADAEVTLHVPGITEPVAKKADAAGVFGLTEPKAGGVYGIRCKMVQNREGEHDGKKYKQIQHYATFTIDIPERFVPREKQEEQEVLFRDEPTKAAADPAATQLLAEARAARALWTDFPGFRADVAVNLDGRVQAGKVDVDAQGKVKLQLDSADDALKTWTRREIASLVAHRLPGGPKDTPCAFADDDTQHPLGRKIRVLNDELHSSYRIRDRQIIEVNRTMKDSRFTITVLENTQNKAGYYLPACYVVSSWNLAGKTLVSSTAYRQTWRRFGVFDLPASLLAVTATPGKLESRSITFTNVTLYAREEIP